jgi:DNA-binding transcriptional MocR family regulator
MRVEAGGISGSPQTLLALDSEQVMPELLPVDELADCARAAFARDGATILSYGSGAGYMPLRELIAEWFGVPPSRVVLTHGQLHGLSLLAGRVATGRGVLVEYPIHDRAERVLLAAGASLIGTPIGEQGIVVDELQNTLGAYVRPAMVYLIPSFHNPTGWTAPAEARRRVVDLVITQNRLQTEQILVVEDETYALTRFEGDRIPAIFDYSEGRTVHSSSFSVVIAPGLRVGYLVLPEQLAADVEQVAADTYITPVLLAQATVHEFLARGALEPHLARLRAGLRTRRDALVGALAKHLPDARWSQPEGGLFVWVQLPGSPDGREVLRRADGVGAVDGTRFGATSDWLRLSFGFAAPDELEAGVERLAAAL